MKTVGEINGWEPKELALIWKHHVPGGRFPYAVSFVRQRNFTVCILEWSDIRALGVAKRAASLDRNRPKIAREIAFGRACKALALELRDLAAVALLGQENTPC